MKLQNLILNLSKDDILKLISLQDKTIVKSLELGDQIKISGIYKLMGLNVDFNGIMSIAVLKIMSYILPLMNLKFLIKH